MTSSNYSHKLKQHQVNDLEVMTGELSTLSDVAYTVARAMNDEFGTTSTGGVQYDLANRLFDLSEELKIFTEERREEAEILKGQPVVQLVEVTA